MAKGVAIVGNNAGAAKTALILAELGIQVKLITSSPVLCPEDDKDEISSASPENKHEIWPMLLRAACNPLIDLYTDSDVTDISGKSGRFTVRTTRKPRYVQNELCTGCNRCAEECSVQVPFIQEGRKVTRSAIHPPVLDHKTIPSAYCIEKTGIAPCRAA
jgi:heterodisulfide reductase subunit A